MGRKQKKGAEGGQSSSEGSQASIGGKGAAGPGGKSNPSSDEAPRKDSPKEKLQKKQKQPSEVTGVQESGKGVKRKTNDRDSSEDTKRQGAKQKTKSGRGGGVSAKSTEAKGGFCSVVCCVGLLSVLVAVAAIAGYAAYLAYPEESTEFMETADVELKQIYRTVREVATKKLDELLVAIGQKTPDETESDQKTAEEDGSRWREESKEEEEEANEEAVIREDVFEDEDTEERVIRKHVPEANEETVIREDVPEDEDSEEKVQEVHEEKKEAEEKVEVQTESELDETAENADTAGGRSEPELDVEDVESLKKELEEIEDSANEDRTADEEEVSEEEVVEDDEEEAEDAREEVGEHWETVEEERVKGDVGSSNEPKDSFESPAAEPTRAEEPIRENEDTVQPGEPVIPEPVVEGTENVQVVEESEVPKQKVPEPEFPEVVHLETPVPVVPRVVVPVEEVLEPQVVDVREVDLDVAQEDSLAEEHLGETVQIKSEEPVAKEQLQETAQSEEPAQTEAHEKPVAFEASDAVNRETINRGLERGDREEAVQEMKQEVVEEIQTDIPATGHVPTDVGTEEEQVHQSIPPVAETEHQEQQPSTVQSAETEQTAEVQPQQDANQEQQQGERFESKEKAAGNMAAESSDEKSSEDELERQLDYLDGFVNTAPKEALDIYNRILDVVPENPRAVIGKAYALGVVANAEQNDVALEQSINEYLKVFSLPSVPKPLMVAGARACAEKQTLRGWGSSAAQTLKSVVAMYPDDLELYNELGQKYVINGAYEDARATFMEILGKDPNDAYARLYLGYIMKLVDKDLGRSLDLMKTGLVGVPVTDLKFYIELGEALTRTGRHSEAHEVYQLAVDRKVLKSVWQRSWYNVDGLTSQPWWTPEQTKNLINLQVLEDFSKAIADEVLGILTNKSDLFQPDSRDIIESGAMKHMKLFVNGYKVAGNCNAAVKTCALLDAFSDAIECDQCEVKFSLLQPGLHTRPHSGPTNCRLTGQLPLVIDPQTTIRVADQTRTYVSNKFLIFDDSFEQELWVASESLQLLLTVEMWHPDLSAELRKNVGPL